MYILNLQRTCPSMLEWRCMATGQFGMSNGIAFRATIENRENGHEWNGRATTTTTMWKIRAEGKETEEIDEKQIVLVSELWRHFQDSGSKERLCMLYVHNGHNIRSVRRRHLGVKWLNNIIHHQNIPINFRKRPNNGQGLAIYIFLCEWHSRNESEEDTTGIGRRRRRKKKLISFPLFNILQSSDTRFRLQMIEHGTQSQWCVWIAICLTCA